jgi:hypothetical protein
MYDETAHFTRICKHTVSLLHFIVFKIKSDDGRLVAYR